LKVGMLAGNFDLLILDVVVSLGKISEPELVL
jgi:hypothetical protein